MKRALPIHLESPRRDAQDGFVLASVLWLLAALAGLASIYSVYSIESATASRVPVDRLQAEAAIRAGAELAAYRALGLPASARPPHGALELSLGDSQVSVRYVSEST